MVVFVGLVLLFFSYYQENQASNNDRVIIDRGEYVIGKYTFFTVLNQNEIPNLTQDAGGSSIWPYYYVYIVTNVTKRWFYEVCVHELCHLDNDYGSTEESICMEIQKNTTRPECDLLMSLVDAKYPAG